MVKGKKVEVTGMPLREGRNLGRRIGAGPISLQIGV